MHLLSGLVTCQKVTNLTWVPGQSYTFPEGCIVEKHSFTDSASFTQFIRNYFLLVPSYAGQSTRCYISLQAEDHKDPLCWRQTWCCPPRMFMHVHVTYRTVRLHDRRRLTRWPFVPRHAIHLVFQRVFSLRSRCASNTTVLTCVPEHVWVKIQYERVSQVYLDADSGFCWFLARHVLYT